MAFFIRMWPTAANEMKRSEIELLVATVCIAPYGCDKNLYNFQICLFIAVYYNCIVVDKKLRLEHLDVKKEKRGLYMELYKENVPKYFFNRGWCLQEEIQNSQKSRVIYRLKNKKEETTLAMVFSAKEEKELLWGVQQMELLSGCFVSVVKLTEELKVLEEQWAKELPDYAYLLRPLDYTFEKNRQRNSFPVNLWIQIADLGVVAKEYGREEDISFMIWNLCQLPLA